MDERATLPAWAEWPQGPHPLGELTIGVEEEVMLVSAISNALANRIEAVMPRLDPVTSAPLRSDLTCSVMGFAHFPTNGRVF